MVRILVTVAAAVAAASMAVAAEAKALTVFPPNHPDLYYSPYNWLVTPHAASTINSAAYLRFMFSGSMLEFNFDVSQMVSPASQVYWKVDNGPATHSLVLETVSVAIPPNNTGKDIPYHTVELFVKSTTERANRWAATGPSTRIILTGITTDGQLAQWIPVDVNVLIYGDSITEGVLTLGGSQKYDTDHNDASVVYSYTLARLLGAEIGVVGFGATALTHSGSGGVVPLTQSYNQLWSGVPRDFTSPKPDLIVFNEGTNDGCDVTSPGCNGTNIVEPMTQVLKELVSKCPGTPIAVLEPFNGGQSAHLQASVAASGSADVHYIETSGFYNLSYGGSLHPTGPNDVAMVAPKIAKKLRPILAKSIFTRIECQTGSTC